MSETSGEAPQVLRHRPFVLFWTSRVLSTLCMQMLAVAVGWQLYALTGRALDLGLVGLVQFIPVLVLTLPAGWLADRGDRRLVVACCQGSVAVLAALLAVGTLRGWLGREAMFLLIGLIGCARAVEAPNMASLLPGLVPRALFPRAAAWSASATQTAQILGPALGGLLYALGPQAAYGTAAMLLLVGGAAAFAIRPPRRAPGAERPGFAGLLEGFGFVLRHRLVLGAISLDLFAVLLGGAVALMPIFARDILGTGPAGLGMLRAAPAVGALATSVWLANRPLRAPVGPRMFAALGAFGLATVVFALSGNLALSCLALAVVGAADVVSVVVRSSLVQLRTPDEMRGRVSAVNSLFVGASNQLGDFRAGSVAALLGAVPAAVLGGIGTLLVAALFMRLFPELRRLERLEG
ncbi:MFS transporter [Dankookia rubra]|uniref:MFS transporter n=1 Tax=Dankookia rubra TaxID=1442381 RepID=A0A4R5QHM4_9PROT|nr:MFS transporter [Dankookia rubra]TDH62854.1 MFS transporter [Dankookia rubra]